MGARIRPFAVVRSGGQWRGTSGTAAGCSGPSRPVNPVALAEAPDGSTTERYRQAWYLTGAP